MADLIVVDHHPKEFKFPSNVTIIKGENYEEFYKNARPYVEQKVDYIIADEDPDGYLSTALYLLHQKDCSDIKYTFHRGGDLQEILDLLHNGVKKIMVLDWFQIYNLDLSHFDNVVIINPHFAGLKPFVNTSELLLLSFSSYTVFEEDLSALASICDACVEVVPETMAHIMDRYKGVLPEANRLFHEGKLDRFHIHETGLEILKDMVWSVTFKEEGPLKLVKKIIAGNFFTFSDLVKGSSQSAIAFMNSCYKRAYLIISNEIKRFEEQKRPLNSLIFVYEPAIKDPIYLSQFATKISFLHQDHFILITSKQRNGLYKYSLRFNNDNIEIDLGKLIDKLAASGLDIRGGGHSRAASCYVRDQDEFEQAFLKEVKKKMAHLEVR